MNYIPAGRFLQKRSVVFSPSPMKRKILKLERLRGNPEFPFVYFISYFNPRIGLTGNEDFSRPLYEILEQDYSSVAKFRKKKSVPSLPTNFWLRSLKSSPGTLYSSENDLYMTRGTPSGMEYRLLRADSFVYTLEFEREV